MIRINLMSESDIEEATDNVRRLKNRLKMQEWRRTNPERQKQIDQETHCRNRNKRNSYCREWRQKNLEYDRIRHSEWRNQNRDAARAIYNRSIAKRKSTPEGKLKSALTFSLVKRLRKVREEYSSLNWMTATMDEYRDHLQSQFTSEMNWENYGKYWHVDHIIPVSAFDLLDVQQRQAAYSLQNLRPLECRENIRKKNRILPEFEYLIPILKPAKLMERSNASMGS